MPASATESGNRTTRALAIADTFRKAGADAEMVAEFGDAEWWMAGQLSGSPIEDYHPSPATRSAVLAILRDTELHPNPFEGFR